MKEDKICRLVMMLAGNFGPLVKVKNACRTRADSLPLQLTFFAVAVECQVIECL